MQDLNNFYGDLFFPLGVAEGTFVEGCDRHIAKLKGNNPGGIYDGIIASSETKIATLKAIISDRDSEDTEQSGSTILMNQKKDDFIHFAQIREGLLKSTFEGVDTPEYKEFLPTGLTEIDNSTLANIETIMDRWVTKATKYETPLGTTFKDACKAKRLAYTDARDAQLINIGQASGLKTADAKALKAMTMQLTTNVHTTALNNTDVPNAADIFFDQQFFTRPSDANIYSGDNVKGQTKGVRSDGWSAGKKIKVTNMGIDAFLICFAAANGVACKDATSIASGASLEFKIEDLGYSIANHFLNITALADGSGAKWKVEVL